MTNNCRPLTTKMLIGYNTVLDNFHENNQVYKSGLYYCFFYTIIINSVWGKLAPGFLIGSVNGNNSAPIFLNKQYILFCILQ